MSGAFVWFFHSTSMFLSRRDDCLFETCFIAAYMCFLKIIDWKRDKNDPSNRVSNG